MTEIQGKSILVRVSARFQLARVRVIGSLLYLLYLDPLEKFRYKTKNIVALPYTMKTTLEEIFL